MAGNRYFLPRFLCALAVVRIAQGSPLQQWYLTGKDLLKDHSGGASDGTLINSQTCPLLSSDKTFGDSSFFFDGAGSSVADLELNGDNKDSFSFTVYLKPDPSIMGTTVTILEYKTDSASSSSSTISRVLVELVNGKVRFTTGNADNDYGSMTYSTALGTATFSKVFVSVNKDPYMYLRIQGNEETFELSSISGSIPFQSGGAMRVGASFGGSDTEYKGKLQCISFFDTGDDVPMLNSEAPCPTSTTAGSCPVDTYSIVTTQAAPATTEATPTTHSTISTEPTITTPTTATPAAQPTYLWPFDNVTRGCDVITGAPALTSQAALACLRTDDSDPAVAAAAGFCPDQAALWFDGFLQGHSAAVEMDVSLAGASPSLGWTVVIFAKPQHPPEGQLWSYAGTSSSGVQVHIHVNLSPNGSLSVRLYDSASLASPCGQLSSAAVFDGTNSALIMVVVGRDPAAGVTLKIGNAVTLTALDTCSWSSGGAAPGTFKVAGRGEGVSAGYRGVVTCMAAYQRHVTDVDKAALLALCAGYNRTQHQGSAQCDDQANDISDKKFKVLAQNKTPLLTSLAPVTTLQALSLVRCAQQCLRTRHCRSFSYSATLLCRLFDFVTLAYLTDEDGRYFEIKTSY